MWVRNIILAAVAFVVLLAILSIVAMNLPASRGGTRRSIVEPDPTGTPSSCEDIARQYGIPISTAAGAFLECGYEAPSN